MMSDFISLISVILCAVCDAHPCGGQFTIFCISAYLLMVFLHSWHQQNIAGEIWLLFKNIKLIDYSYPLEIKYSWEAIDQ